MCRRCCSRWGEGGWGDLLEPINRTRWERGVGYPDRDIFEAFLKLPVPQRHLIREVILTFAKVHTTDKG